MKLILMVIIICGLTGCAGVETEEQFFYLLGSELQYSLDNKAWEKKYGIPKESEKNFKPFPYDEEEVN